MTDRDVISENPRALLAPKGPPGPAGNICQRPECEVAADESGVFCPTHSKDSMAIGEYLDRG